MKGPGGGKRGSRKPKRVESDDRPRGYEATRMRKLWRDIDDAKQKAGLGVPADPGPAASWDASALLELAAGLVVDAAARVGEAAAWVTAAAPTACALFASGADLLRGLPVLGRLVELFPAPAPAMAARPRRSAAADHHANGFVRPVTVDPETPEDPEGGWLH